MREFTHEGVLLVQVGHMPDWMRQKLKVEEHLSCVGCFFCKGYMNRGCDNPERLRYPCYCIPKDYYERFKPNERVDNKRN